MFGALGEDIGYESLRYKSPHSVDFLSSCRNPPISGPAQQEAGDSVRNSHVSRETGSSTWRFGPGLCPAQVVFTRAAYSAS